MAQVTPFEVYNSSVPVPEWIDQRILGTDSAESYTVPARAQFGIISADNPIALRVTSTAVYPAADISDGTGSLYIPSTAQFRLESGATYSIIRKAGTATIVTIGVYY